MTAIRIDSDRPSFLIMATDGLWDNLSNKQAVDLVATWLETSSTQRRKNKPSSGYPALDFSQLRKGIDPKFVESRATVVDDNVAVHLTRNSLGGNHHELIAGRLALDAPFARRLHDEITVQVVLFSVSGTI